MLPLAHQVLLAPQLQGLHLLVTHRANLHLGAIGVGIDMATGVTTSAIYKNKIIDSVPGTRLLLSGIQIPFWQEILYMAAKVQVVTGLGYLGVDLVIDDLGHFPLPKEVEAAARQNGIKSIKYDKLDNFIGEVDLLVFNLHDVEFRKHTKHNLYHSTVSDAVKVLRDSKVKHCSD